jgi:hypothetical protein
MPISNRVPDSALKIYANDWVATILCGGLDNGFQHIVCNTVGSSQAKALEAAEYVIKAFAAGRKAFIRAKPAARSETDFETREIRHEGYVRFSYSLEPGEWQFPDESQIVSLGGF